MEILQPSWRGRSICTRKDSEGQKFTAMVGKNSLLYLPIGVLENSIYRITIELCKESGNGILFCNIYGNKNFDFPAVKIECDRDGWCTYDIDITTKSFPKTVPMMFRLWRSAAGTGAILVKKVIVELLNGNAKKLESPVMISTQKATFNSRNKGTVRRGRRKLSTPPHKIPGYNSGGVVERAGKVNIPRQIVPLLPIGKFMPTVGPLVPGESGIKNSVIISTRNREEFLNRTLFTYAKQTMPLKEFELVIMDDGSTDDILGLCKRHAKMSGLQFQYIKVDSSKGAIEQRGWTPALTNNIGFKKARGAVFIITGPETLQKETNMERTWRICNAPKCVYGVVYKSNEKFVDSIRKNPQWVEYTHFRTIMDKHKNDLDGNVTGGFWWYYAATRKEYIMTTRGVDERFMLGMTGEDDNFADRMRFLGLSIFHDHKILGIHQNHTREDRSDRTHKMRFNEEQWLDLRNNNVKLLWDCRKSGDPIVNKGINWGAEEAILEMKVF